MIDIRIAALEARITRLEARLAEPTPTLALHPLRQVVQLVAREFGLSPAEMVSASQTAELVAARQTAALLMRRVHSASYTRIGRALARDHSTVIHATTGAALRLTRDPAYAARVARLEATLKELAA